MCCDGFMYGDMERRGNVFMKFAKNCFVTRAVVLDWPHPTVYVVLQPILQTLEKYSVFFIFFYINLCTQHSVLTLCSLLGMKSSVAQWKCLEKCLEFRFQGKKVLDVLAEVVPGVRTVVGESESQERGG